jgi:hypothetical protein
LQWLVTQTPTRLGLGLLLLPVLIVDASQGPDKHLRGKASVLATSQHLIEQGVEAWVFGLGERWLVVLIRHPE